MAPSPASPTRLVLTVDGGGMRGLLAARALEELERRLGAPASRVFDVGAGVSTGALVVCGALGLRRPLSGTELAACYHEIGPRVFGRAQGAPPRVSLHGDPAAHARLRALIEPICSGQAFLDAPARLIIPAADVGRRAGVLFDSGRGAEGTYGQADVRLADVVLASSALPGYFPPVRVGHGALVDGGMWAKDPTGSAVRRLHEDDPAPLVVVSLGTGRTMRRQGGADVVAEIVSAKLGRLPDASIPPAAPVEMLRLEPPLPPGAARVDAASDRDLEALEEIAAAYVRDAADEFERAAALLRRHVAPSAD
ncbi:patatin-like phospholipase family protein [Patulibacter sp. SYSU D01012]|uniref:patatin-like phospholipase family protein n=1 Tax=Patulibacter sp. SYSU D01012 TaxID=2817381 RepID=UPI001B302F2B|nr:patatin-like phospholipase family protein [Patulibacter sp. SYSU D01012]